MLVLILWMFAAVAVEAPPVAPSPSKDTPSTEQSHPANEAPAGEAKNHNLKPARVPD